MLAYAARPIAAITVALLAGCVLPNFTGLSPLPDSAEVRLTGRVLTPEGGPYAGAAVRLEKVAPAAADWDDGTAITTVGTDTDGQYAFRVAGASTKNRFGEAYYYRFVAEQETGRQVSYRFQIRRPAIELPALRFWSGLAAPVIAPGAIQLAWTPPSDPARAYHVTVATLAGETVWQETTAAATLTLPQYLLADGASYRWQVEAITEPFIVTSDFGLLAGALDATKRVIELVSIEDDQGGSYPGWFDGVVERPATSTAPPTDAREVIVDLGRPRDIARLVVWGASTGLAVAVSEDRSAWAPLGSVKQGEYVDHGLGAARGRYLQLKPLPESEFGNLRELRVIAAEPVAASER